jgi:hypothetical protein
MVFQVAGTNEAALDPGYYPQFSEFSSNFPDCENKLKELSSPPHAVPGKNLYFPIPGLSLSVDIPEAYRKNGSILITWTLRIEGVSSRVPVSSLCSPWWGSVTETFKSAQVYSRAYISYDEGKTFNAEGQDLGMTIPGGLNIRDVTPPPPPPRHDPTHSGSYLLEPPDGGEFPSQIKVQIYWRNDTSMKIFSKANYRSLIVTLIPPEKK